MKINADQFARGLVSFADDEVIGMLPTSGKWVAGTMVGIIASKINEIFHDLQTNAIVKMTGIIDEDGMFDVDVIVDHMKQSARRYGCLVVDLPFVGEMKFDENDIESLHRHLERV